jgi:hypothetical protein
MGLYLATTGETESFNSFLLLQNNNRTEICFFETSGAAEKGLCKFLAKNI